MKMNPISLLLAFTLIPVTAALSAPQLSQSMVWETGEGGYDTHFVYGIGVTWNDTILVACEGRIDNVGDVGEKDLLVKRSTDFGATWIDEVVIEGTSDNLSWTNPAFVTDGVTTYLFYGGVIDGIKRIFYRTTTDNGETWSSRSDITGLWAGNPAGWTQRSTLGHGIKKLKSPAKNRVMVAFHHRTNNTSNPSLANYGNDVIYLTSSGAWAIAGGPPIDLTRGTNESRIAERTNGTVVMIARKRWDASTYQRARVTSNDAGANWHNWVDATGITGSICDAGLIRFSDSYMLYSYPSAPGSAREDMTIKASTDGGITWGAANLLHEGPATYSDLAVDSFGNIYCIYGRDGNNHNYGGDVYVARFNIEWVTGTDKPTIVLDNDSNEFSTNGAWSSSSTIPGYTGDGYVWSSSGSNTATWTPSITIAGDYEVYMRWTSHSNRPENAPVEIHYNGGSSSVSTTVNQKEEGGSWQYLGTYNLSTGSGNFVRLFASDSGSTIANAVRFQKR